MTDFGLDALDDLQKSQDEGLEVKIFEPGTENVLFTVVVAGPDSEQQRRANERGEEEHSARGANTPLTREESQQVGYRYLARCCMRWSFKHPKDGHEIPFNEDTAYELIKRYPYVKVQIDAAAANRLRFIRRSQTA